MKKYIYSEKYSNLETLRSYLIPWSHLPQLSVRTVSGYNDVGKLLFVTSVLRQRIELSSFI